MYSAFKYNKRLKGKARNLRRNQTDAESLLWSRLRSRQLAGFKFRRQHPMGKYVVDFYCEEKKLAIELDGGQHATSKQSLYDAQRTRYLRKQGIVILRFWDNDVFMYFESILEKIFSHLHSP